MSYIKTIVKSNGKTAKFEPEKLNKWASWASKGVVWSDIATEAVKACYDGCSTSNLHKAMIDACLRRKTKPYADMASNLLLGQVYKEAFGGYKKIPTLKAFYHKMVNAKLWANMHYSDMELDTLSLVLDHKKDETYPYWVIRQAKDKYLIQDVATDTVKESPQFMWMGIAMDAMSKRNKEHRIADVIQVYQYLSDLKINLPTPTLNAMRTTNRASASCCLLMANDTAPSLGIASHIAYDMTTAQAGIGAYLQTRSITDTVKKNRIKHQGKLPYYKHIDTAVKANKQQSRGGSATVSFLAVDPEVDVLLALNNQATTLQSQIKFMDYSIGFNRFFWQQVAKNGDWYLVSYKESPEYHEAMFDSNPNRFIAEFNRIAQDDKIKKKVVKAMDVASIFLTNRLETGRIYCYWTDTINNHTSFKEPIKQSNLCVAGDTLIGFNNDRKPISSLVGEFADVWNGKEWTKAYVQKTGENQELYRVEVEVTTEGLAPYRDQEVGGIKTLDCTAYHKFYKLDGQEVRTHELETEMELEPILVDDFRIIRQTVKSVTKLEGLHDTYCVNEPKRHRAVFNGILTGQCQEITLPTAGYESMPVLYGLEEGEGEVALCFLSSLVAGRVSEEEYEDVCYYTLLIIESVMDSMQYPYAQVKRTAQARRSVGVGLTNLAHYIASHKVKYGSQESKQLVHDLAELHSYSMHKASLRLARELGNAEWIHKTKYPEGWLPIDTYTKELDNVVPNELKYDWESLRKEIIEQGGIRHSALMAMMPNESSSLASNTTNGLYPVRDTVIYKSSEKGNVLFIAPELGELEEYYTSAFEVDTKDLIDIYALVQKFTDQAISADTYINISNLEGGRVSLRSLLKEMLYATKMGMKTLYYFNTRTAEKNTTTDLINSEISQVEPDEDYDDEAGCESCKL